MATFDVSQNEKCPTFRLTWAKKLQTTWRRRGRMWLCTGLFEWNSANFVVDTNFAAPTVMHKMKKKHHRIYVVQFTSKYLNLFSRNFNKFSGLFEAFHFLSSFQLLVANKMLLLFIFPSRSLPHALSKCRSGFYHFMLIMHMHVVYEISSKWKYRKRIFRLAFCLMRYDISSEPKKATTTISGPKCMWIGSVATATVRKPPPKNLVISTYHSSTIHYTPAINVGK